MARLPASRGWLLFPPGVWLLFLLAFAVGGLLIYTRLGRHVFAVGSNEQAARLCGIPVARVKLAVYVLGGLFAGAAGLMQFSRLTVGDPTGANGLELNVIAAVVIGGGSLAGGEGLSHRRAHRRAHHANAPVGLLPDGLAQLGPGDRHRRHHRRRRRAGSLPPQEVLSFGPGVTLNASEASREHFGRTQHDDIHHQAFLEPVPEEQGVHADTAATIAST